MKNEFPISKKWRIGMAVVFILIVMIWRTFATVPTGKACVVTTWGKAGGVADEGVNWKFPHQSHECFTVRQVVLEANDLDSSTVDGQQVSLDVSVQFQLQEPNVEDVYRNFAKNDEQLVDDVVKQQLRSISRDVAANYSATDLYTGSAKVQYQLDVSAALTKELARYHVTVIDFNLRDTTFSKEYEEAINQQQIAKENVETKRFEAEAATFDAAKEIEISKGHAEAIRIEGLALREFPEILQQQFISEQDVQFWVLPSDGEINMFMPFGAPPTVPAQ